MFYRVVRSSDGKVALMVGTLAMDVRRGDVALIVGSFDSKFVANGVGIVVLLHKSWKRAHELVEAGSEVELFGAENEAIFPEDAPFKAMADLLHAPLELDCR